MKDSRLAHAPGAPVRAAGDAGPSRLLVIGDDDGQRATLDDLLGNEGHAVRTAADVPGGLRLTREFEPDLVLFDWVPARLDAPDYCRQVKADPALRGTYITMLCDSGSRRERIAGLDAGADDVLVRPFEEDELRAHVRAGLRVRKQLRQIAGDERREALVEMAATLGHEINNPLTALFGHMELVLHYLEQGDSYRMQHHIREAGQVAARIGRVAQRLMHLVEPRTKTYLDQLRMLDL